MDSGHAALGEPLEEDYDTTMELLPEELIWIMDQLLCHEVHSVPDREDLSITGELTSYLDRLHGK